MTRINLDKTAAECAQKMVGEALKLKESNDKEKKVKKPAETLERLATKALGVLQSQGVYALMLFLFSRSRDEAKIAEQAVRPELYAALEVLKHFNVNELPCRESDTNKEMQETLSFYSEKICKDLDLLLFVRQLYEQALIYARYHAKAVND